MDIFMEFVKKYKVTIVLSLICLVLLLICNGLFASPLKRAVTDKELKTAQLQSDMKMIEQQLVSDAQKNDSSNGLNQKRFLTDTKLLGDVFSYMFTFDNLDTYQSIRKGLITEYGVSEKDDIFLFYPEVGTDESHRREYKPIENGNYKLAYESFVPYVVNINNGEYSYLSDVTVKSGEKVYHVYMLCTVSDDGTIVKMRGCTPQDATKQVEDVKKEETSTEETEGSTSEETTDNTEKVENTEASEGTTQAE